MQLHGQRYFLHWPVFIIGAILPIAAYFFVFDELPGFRKSVELEQEQITVRLGWVHQAQFAGMYVAKEKGFYAEVGLDVELLPLDPGSDQMLELGAGDVEFSIVEAHQLLTGIDQGVDAVAVAAIYQINPHVLASRADSGIISPADFSGATFGLAGGAGEGTSLLEVFIENIGGLDEVRYVELGFDTVDDFLNKRADVIDIYRIDQPFLAAREGLSLNIIPLESYGLSTYGDVIAVNRELVLENPDLVRRFVQATMRGWEFVLRHPDEAVSTTLLFAQGDYWDREYQEHILIESLPLIRGEEFRIGNMNLVPWSTLYESMRGVGAVEHEILISEVFTNKFLK